IRDSVALEKILAHMQKVNKEFKANQDILQSLRENLQIIQNQVGKIEVKRIQGESEEAYLKKAIRIHQSKMETQKEDETQTAAKKECMDKIYLTQENLFGRRRSVHIWPSED